MLAADVVERLVDFAGADIGDRALRFARRAMQDAFREFPGLHRWTYHYTHGRIPLLAGYSAGTVQYDNATRHLTLTGGVFPSWANLADVRICNVVSDVASRDSDTQLTLSATVNPGAYIAAGSAYSLYQDKYILPADFLASDAAIAQNRFGSMKYIHPTASLWSQRVAQRVGVPIYYTFLPDRFVAGRYAVMVTPYPDCDQTLDFIYQRRLKRLKYDNVNAGKVSITNGLTALTGTGTAWTSDLVGAYVRISSNGTAPTSIEGSNQAAVESKITAVASSTSLTIADTVPQDFTGVAYLISDLVDIEDGVMANAFYWQTMRHMADDLRMKDRPQIAQTAMESLVRAKEHDARNFSLETAGPSSLSRPSRRYMPTGPDDA